MSSAVEIPQQDEVIKTLVSRCKRAPSSNAFVELASALLARGHATEALRVAEHGLMLVPANVEGRAERAAALLALGRPRVAYVELMRALAIHPGHQRAMRLLGRAFMDAGAPGRAAELLARRSADPEPPEHGSPNLADPDRGPTTPGDLPSLFSALTEDLGLGAAAVEARTRRVEVTQLMRRRGTPRPPRTERELESIEGPIVETTQPRPASNSSEYEPRSSSSTLAADARLEDAALGFPVDDEPLFQEHLPFAVHPVDRVESETSLANPTQTNLSDHPGSRVASPAAHPADVTLPPRHAPGTRPPQRTTSRMAARSYRPPKTDDDTPVPGLSRFEVAQAPRSPRRVMLAAFAALLMLVYLGALVYLSGDDLRVWLSELSSLPAEILPR